MGAGAGGGFQDLRRGDALLHFLQDIVGARFRAAENHGQAGALEVSEQGGNVRSEGALQVVRRHVEVVGASQVVEIEGGRVSNLTMKELAAWRGNRGDAGRVRPDRFLANLKFGRLPENGKNGNGDAK